MSRSWRREGSLSEAGTCAPSVEMLGGLACTGQPRLQVVVQELRQSVALALLGAADFRHDGLQAAVRSQICFCRALVGSLQILVRLFVLDRLAKGLFELRRVLQGLTPVIIFHIALWRTNKPLGCMVVCECIQERRTPNANTNHRYITLVESSGQTGDFQQDAQLDGGLCLGARRIVAAVARISGRCPPPVVPMLRQAACRSSCPGAQCPAVVCSTGGRKDVVVRSCIRWLVLGSVVVAGAGSAGAEPWRFAVVSDTHVGSSGVWLGRLSQLAESLAQERLDVLLVTGDLVLDGTRFDSRLDAWRKALKPVYDAGVQVLPIRGNHDDSSRPDIWRKHFGYLPQNGPAGEEGLTYAVDAQECPVHRAGRVRSRASRPAAVARRRPEGQPPAARLRLRPRAGLLLAAPGHAGEVPRRAGRLLEQPGRRGRADVLLRARPLLRPGSRRRMRRATSSSR